MVKKKSKKKSVQSHHISYDPEEKVVMYKGEHWIMTQMNRRKLVSRGFIISLKVWIALHEDLAVHLVVL